MKLSERYAKEKREGLHKVPTKEEIESWKTKSVNSIKENKYVHFRKASMSYDDYVESVKKLLYDYSNGIIRCGPDMIERQYRLLYHVEHSPLVSPEVAAFIVYVECNHLEDVVLCELEETSWDEFKKAVDDGWYRCC